MREDAARGGLTIAAKADFQDYTYQAESLRHQESMAVGNEMPPEEDWTQDGGAETQQEAPAMDEPGSDRILPGHRSIRPDSPLIFGTEKTILAMRKAMIRLFLAVG